jgi:hypothetical protein
MAGEHLILTDEQGEKQQDDMFARLSQIARPMDAPAKKKKRIVSKARLLKKNPDRKSSFFFKPSASFDAEIRQHQEAVKPKKLKHADREITARARKLRNELPPVLAQNIDEVRELFLTEIAPRTLAAQTGTMQARTVAQRLLKGEVGAQPFVQFERMVEVGAQIQMAKFVTRYMGLPAREWRNILEALNPKQQQPREVLFMNQPPTQQGPLQAPQPPKSDPSAPPSNLRMRRRVRDEEGSK